MKSPIVLLMSMLDDVKRLMPCVKGIDRDKITINHRFEHEGYGFLSITLCDLSEAIDVGLENGRMVCPTSFRKKKGSALPSIFSGLLYHVFDNQGDLLPNPSTECILTLRQLTRLYKKVSTSPKRESILVSAAVDTFYSTDASLSDIDFDDRKVHLLDRVSRFCLNSLSFDLSSGENYRHGPGGVYESVVSNQKWVRLLDDLSSGGKYDLVDLGFGDLHYDGYLSEGTFKPVYCTPYGGLARFVTVPKTSKSVRSITVEPLVNQFVQQGLNYELRRAIDGCSVLSSCLALTNQSYNQVLALIGSRTRNFVTIDLKSASDLLSVKLVKICFSRHPSFMEWMFSSRSSAVETPRGILPLHKYAGMGNATTFPVQSICFALICIAAILDSSGKSITKDNVVATANSIRVYGDDIIVPSEYYHTVSSWLECFGLMINTSKTFSKGFFRESCGADCYAGVDITPTYLRVDPGNSALSASDIASLVATSNQLWLKGYYKASDTIRLHVEDLLKKRLPLVSPNSGLLGLCDRYGSTEVHGWNSALHCPSVEGLKVIPKTFRSKLDDRPALLKFYLTSLIERRSDHLKMATKRFSTRLVKRWVPAFCAGA